MRSDIELDIYLAADRLSLINNPWAARGQRRPAHIVATSSPGNPCWTPIQIASGKPYPAVIGKIGPATVMIRCPAEIFVGNPRPPVIGVGPVAICVRTPVWIIHCHVWLPAVAVICNLYPVSTGEIIVKEIDRYVGSPRLWDSWRDQCQHCHCKKYFFHSC